MNQESRLASPLTILLIALVGVVSFGVFLVLIAYAPELRRGERGGPDAYSRSAVGYAGLVEFLRAQDIATKITADDNATASDGVLILTPPPDLTLDPKSRIENGDATTLIVLPKWETRRDPAHRGWVRRQGLLEPTSVASALAPLVQGSLSQASVVRRGGEAAPTLTGPKRGLFRGRTFTPGPIRSLQVVEAPNLVALLTDAAGGTVLGQVQDHDVYVLADPDLLNTQGLTDPATAALALALVNALRDDDPVSIDVTLAGEHRARDILRTAFEPPFLAATLCAAAAALLMGLHAVRRFGPAIGVARAFEPGKRALAGNAAALVTLARREHRMAAPYAELTRSTAADLLNARSDAALDRIARLRRVSPPFAELRAEADEARNPADLMRIARKLSSWKQDMLRADR